MRGQLTRFLKEDSFNQKLDNNAISSVTPLETKQDGIDFLMSIAGMFGSSIDDEPTYDETTDDKSIIADVILRKYGKK